MNSKQAKAIRKEARKLTTEFSLDYLIKHTGIRKYKCMVMKDGIETEVEIPYNTYNHTHPVGSYRNILKKT